MLGELTVYPSHGYRTGEQGQKKEFDLENPCCYFLSLTEFLSVQRLDA